MTYKNYSVFVPLRLLYFALEMPDRHEQLPAPGVSGEKIASYPVDEAKSEFTESKNATPSTGLDSSANLRAEQIATRIAPGPEVQDRFLKQIDADFDPDTEVRPVILSVLDTIEQRLTFDRAPIDTESASLLKELMVTPNIDPQAVTTLGLRSEFESSDNKLYITGLYATASFGDEPTSIEVGAISSSGVLDAVSLHVERGGFSGSFTVEPKTGQFTGEVSWSVDF